MVWLTGDYAIASQSEALIEMVVSTQRFSYRITSLPQSTFYSSVQIKEGINIINDKFL